MLRKLFLFFLLLPLISCSAQKPQGIKQVDAFFQVRVPGTIPVISDEKSAVDFIDTLYVIYIQTDVKAPEWKKAWSSNQAFLIEVSKVADASSLVGFHKATGEEIRLTIGEGKQLTRLLLKKVANYIKPPAKVKSGQLLLMGYQAGKEVFIQVKELTELLSPLHQ